MKIIIAGAGEVGTHLAKMLRNENHDIVVIDPEESRLRAIESTLDVMTLNGSSTSFEMLKNAGIKKADLFIAVAHSEDINLTSAILGKNLGARKTIARVDNDEYLLLPYKEQFNRLGIDYLIYPEKIAAREVVGLLHQTETTEFFDFSGGKLSLFVFKLDKNAPIINKTLAEVTKQDKPMDYRAVAITRNGMTIIPGGDDHFELNDLVYVVSTRSGLEEIFEYTGKKKFGVKNLMILGGSRIGKTTALELQKQFNIKLIEIDKEKCDYLADVLEDTLVINGDGRDTDLLCEEGLRSMDAFVAVTGNSETNILSCLFAKKIGVKKTIAEIENIQYIGLAENIGIDTVVNKKLTTASKIFRFTRRAQVSQIKYLTVSDAEVLEFVVKEGAKVTEGALKDIDFPKDAMVGGVIRGRSAFIARGDTEIRPNDRAVVFALPSAFNKIEKFF
ncbi:MAG: Trk system potassium transporter TrkA [Bacteroidales bacterium]|nr:MAG: Trk system potassium transporter TrkA [Bacteroidales bacterium]